MKFSSKRIISFLLAMLMMINVMPTSFAAEQEVPDPGTQGNGYNVSLSFAGNAPTIGNDYYLYVKFKKNAGGGPGGGGPDGEVYYLVPASELTNVNGVLWANGIRGNRDIVDREGNQKNVDLTNYTISSMGLVKVTPEGPNSDIKPKNTIDSTFIGYDMSMNSDKHSVNQIAGSEDYYQVNNFDPNNHGIVLEKATFEPATTSKAILGGAFEYGVVADRYEQTGHTETNMAVKAFYQDNSQCIEIDGNGENEIPFYVGNVENHLTLGQKTNVDSYVFVPLQSVQTVL